MSSCGVCQKSSAFARKTKKDDGNKEPENQYANYKVAMVSSNVGTDEFILQAKNKLDDMAKEYGFTASVLECASTDDWEQKTRTACEQGYNLIVGVGWNAAAPFSTLQEEFPDVQFGVIDTIAEKKT